MTWTRSSALALAKPNCTECFGLGIRSGGQIRCKICACVYRAVFRACYNQFRKIATGERKPYVRQRGASFSRPREEYCADFLAIAKRSLSAPQHEIFRLHHLLGAEYRLCARQFGLDKGEFFHEVYRIQRKLGRAFAECEPYGLFPVDEYLGGTVRRRPHPLTVIDDTEEQEPRRVGRPRKFPLAKSAA